MRDKLKQWVGRCLTFSGVVGVRERYLDEFGGVQNVLCLINIRFADGKVATDHMWFEADAWPDGLQKGEMLKFEALVEMYEKGKKGWGEGKPLSIDYRLACPTHIRRIIKPTASGEPVGVKAKAPRPGDNQSERDFQERVVQVAKLNRWRVWHTYG